MAETVRRVKVLRDATCMYCHKSIAKNRKAVSVQHGLSFFYYHPSCYKKVPSDKR